MSDSDELMFAAEDDAQFESPGDFVAKSRWKIVIVDDDPGIHDVTKLTLADFEFAGRGLSFISCYSGAEAREVLADHPDAALIILDVVMESEHAGLDVARYIREELKNWQSRIVLRTGQPGQAPERQVVADYDINDYKEKTDLTATKLYTLLCSSLRSYRDIVTIEQNRRGLEQVIRASANIFELKSMNTFAEGTLKQLTALLHLDPSAVYLQAGGGSEEGAARPADEKLRVLAGTGDFSDLTGADGREVLPAPVVARLDKAAALGTSSFEGGDFVGYFKDRNGATNLTYMSCPGAIDPLDRHLLDLFIRNVSIAFENAQLHEDIAETQREIVCMLGEAVESRAPETGHHVRRVAEISRILAGAYGLGGEEADLVALASPLHDIGKIGIPDAILNKPGKLDPDEWEVMKSHSRLGHDMLAGSHRKILRAGAIIALEHHEKWDGSGYPDGKAGDDIHVFARLTAIADVFDVLGGDRVYAKAWPLERIVDHMKAESGRHFDPRGIALLIENLDEIAAVRTRYADRPGASG